MITVDKEFLAKLEESLKKLAKQNERVKQAVKDKEEFMMQVEKLRHKIRLLKHDKAELLQDRENLIQQIHKLECKLKQAQVILNIEESGNNSAILNRTNCYDPSNQKGVVGFGLRDVSPEGISQSKMFR